MKAIALTHYLPSDHPDCFIAANLPDPVPGPRDLLVRVTATSVNPVDTKVRSPKAKIESSPRVLGWDAVGEVIATGSEVTLFKAGDRVWYAGDISRPGSNSALQLVDERIAAIAPATLSDVEAAALPLTAITAQETLVRALRPHPRESWQTADHRRRRWRRLHRHPAGPPAHRHGGDCYRLPPREP